LPLSDTNTAVDQKLHQFLIIAERRLLSPARVHSHTASTVTVKGVRDYASDVDMTVEKEAGASARGRGK
jgi:hypothetical protein